MNNLIATTNSVRKNDKFAVASFVLGIMSIFFSPLIGWFALDGVDSLMNWWKYPHIEETLVWSLLLLSLAIPLAAIILAIAGIIRTEKNKERKGQWFAVTGFIFAFVVLSFYVFLAGQFFLNFHMEVL